MRSTPAGPSGWIDPTNDFSGLTSSAWALARAAARSPIELLDRCMSALPAEYVETNGPGLRALSTDTVANCLLGVLWHQALEFKLGLFMFEMGRSGPRKDRSELHPGIRGAHVDNAYRLDARLRRLNAEQRRRLAALDTAPELPLSGDDQVLVE